MEPDSTRIAEFAGDAARGDADAAARLVPLVYEELRALAGKYLRGERRDHTLQPTALVHEAYLKLADQSRMDWKGRTHFLAVAATEMRRIIVDHARAQKRVKRGRGWTRVVLSESIFPTEGVGVDVLDLQDALNELTRLHERQARVVELRFFAGLTVEEIAQALEVSDSTVERDWRVARAWLRVRLEGDEP